ncbi:hypothetical protein [Rhizobium sp. G21]|uniref:hypothetical protein n=1 Tax=Rhizobium sp. G21 TaxID=2758439 RepID=UPI0016017ED7|nr:hypothetical protein [Rhizobium sp. G21]MBB1249207.1 hypothetical protein [Rhizobium sp. G21]
MDLRSQSVPSRIAFICSSLTASVGSVFAADGALSGSGVLWSTVVGAASLIWSGGWIPSRASLVSRTPFSLAAWEPALTRTRGFSTGATGGTSTGRSAAAFISSAT